MDGMGKVRVRLCFSNHQETVIGDLLGFENTFSGFSATQGFALVNWCYEHGQPDYCVANVTHDKPLFIKWDSVFVIETLDKTAKQLMAPKRRRAYDL